MIRRKQTPERQDALGAAGVNAIIDAIHAAERLDVVPPLSIEHTSDAVVLSLDGDADPSVLVRLSGFAAGRYDWVEVAPDATGALADKAGGRTSDDRGTAIEINSLTGLYDPTPGSTPTYARIFPTRNRNWAFYHVRASSGGCPYTACVTIRHMAGDQDPWEGAEWEVFGPLTGTGSTPIATGTTEADGVACFTYFPTSVFGQPHIMAVTVDDGHGGTCRQTFEVIPPGVDSCEYDAGDWFICPWRFTLTTGVVGQVGILFGPFSATVTDSAPLGSIPPSGSDAPGVYYWKFCEGNRTGVFLDRSIYYWAANVRDADFCRIHLAACGGPVEATSCGDASASLALPTIPGGYFDAQCLPAVANCVVDFGCGQPPPNHRALLQQTLGVTFFGPCASCQPPGGLIPVNYAGVIGGSATWVSGVVGTGVYYCLDSAFATPGPYDTPHNLIGVVTVRVNNGLGEFDPCCVTVSYELTPVGGGPLCPPGKFYHGPPLGCGGKNCLPNSIAAPVDIFVSFPSGSAQLPDCGAHITG